MAHPAHRDPGVWLVLAYKVGKAVAWTILATVLGLAAVTGHLDHVRQLAADLHHQLVSRWAIQLAKLAMDALSPKGLRLVELALAVDAVVSLLEAWALWRGERWGAWLVLAASALPLPLEAWHFARHPSAGRAALLAVNLAVVLYLARWLRRHHAGAEAVTRPASSRRSP
jgi:uncharacterized membrane protein (DUF2068 family)